MSAEYIAYLNDVDYGPVSFEDLNSMWSRGEVTDDTHVRFSDQTNWMTWKDLRTLKMEDPARMAGEEMQEVQPKVQALYLPGVRDKLRELTAYPVLRGCLIVLLIISVIGLALSGWALTYDDYRRLGIAGIISSFGLIFSILILSVLIDIADALLAKLD